MITPVKYDKHGSSIELKKLMTKGNMDDQTNIKFLKQEEFNSNIVKRLESIEDFREQTLIRLNQGIENRTRAFEQIEVLERQVSILKDLLDRYFTLEINNIGENHGKKERRKM